MRIRAFAPLLVLVLGGPQTAFGRGHDTHLVPVSGTLSGFDFQVEYDQAVRKTLISEASDSPFLRMLVEPSFEPEWVVDVQDPVGDRAVIRVATAKSPVWSGGAPAISPATTEEGDIPADLAALIKRAWVLALRTTRYPKPSNTMDFDGATFEFVSFVEGEGNLAGQAWSPEDGSIAGRLVEEGMMLRHLTGALYPTKQGQIQELSQHVKKLLKTLSARN